MKYSCNEEDFGLWMFNIGLVLGVIGFMAWMFPNLNSLTLNKETLKVLGFILMIIIPLGISIYYLNNSTRGRR